MRAHSPDLGRRSILRRNAPLWIAAALSSALWVLSGALNGALTWNAVLGASVGAVLPPTVPLFAGARDPLWASLAALAGALAIAAVHRLVSGFFGAANPSRARFATLWLAAVIAGGLVGFAADLATIVDAFPPGRLQMLLDGLGTQAGIGAYWGLVQGWVPALAAGLFARRRSRGDRRNGSRLDSHDGSRGDGAERAGEVGDAAGDRADAGAPRRRGVLVSASVAVIALVLVGVVGVTGLRVAQTESVQQDAVANSFDESSGALPDPYAEGDPVPTVAPDAVSPASGWCTPDQAMMLLGDDQAATGHRVLAVTLMNFSDAPCVVDGYPDFAFEDQNGHLLDVTFERGGSFMSTDPGAQRVEIPAQGSAVTYLGWDANSTRGELVASKLYGAMYAGETRGSWPVSLDVAKGSTVSVTAWALKPAGSTDTP